MTFSQVIFAVLALATVGAAIAVVTLRNLFHAALMLVVAFFGVAGFYVLLDAGFFAAAQVLVYIGAISILIIFSVMLTRGVFMPQARNSQSGYVAVAAAILFILIAALVGPWSIPWQGAQIGALTLPARPFGNPAEFSQAVPKLPVDYINLFGQKLVTEYFVAFLLSGVLLLLAMIGAIWVARERKLVEVVAERRAMAAEAAAEAAADEAAGKTEAAPAPVGEAH